MTEQKPAGKKPEELKDDDLDSAQGGAPRGGRPANIQNEAEYIGGVVVKNDSPLRK